MTAIFLQHFFVPRLVSPPLPSSYAVQLRFVRTPVLKNYQIIIKNNIQQYSAGLPFILFPLFKSFNPLSPNNDQHQFSPNSIHRLLRAKSMRINKLITKRSIFDLLSNSLNQFFKEMYGDQSGEFVCRYWGLKD